MKRTRNPNWGRDPYWPHELAEALGSIAMAFPSYEFLFAHIIGFAEKLDKATFYRELLPFPPSKKLDRFRRYINNREDDISRFYTTVCDRFEENLTDRNHYIHAYWYYNKDDKITSHLLILTEEKIH
jgi:hypothetical protein